MGPFGAVGGGGGGGLWAVSKVKSSARVSLAFRGSSCWEASVTLYLWFPFGGGFAVLKGLKNLDKDVFVK